VAVNELLNLLFFDFSHLNSGHIEVAANDLSNFLFFIFLFSIAATLMWPQLSPHRSGH
jgi:hypothetical protein